jgi:hypothetical protein
MASLQELELKRIMKELDFYESDYEYKNEIVMQAEMQFIKNVNDFLSQNPELKAIFDEKIQKRLEDNIKKKTKEEEEEELNDNLTEDDKEDIKFRSPKMKKLYREIVKKTHPDKIKDKKLNDIYIKATKYYDDGDLLYIYKICSDLHIYYEIEIEDNEFLKDKIVSFKDKINFIQATYTWKWNFTENESAKNLIILDYIKGQIK